MLAENPSEIAATRPLTVRLAHGAVFCAVRNSAMERHRDNVDDGFPV